MAIFNSYVTNYQREILVIVRQTLKRCRVLLASLGTSCCLLGQKMAQSECPFCMPWI